MRILIIEHANGKCILVKVDRRDSIQALRSLVGTSDRKTVIGRVLNDGTVLKVMRAEAFPLIDADLTLTDEGAYWTE